MKRDDIYVNRELRWLSFNERVLQAAENTRNPLMERLKFIGIFSSNLDEFYSVRVGSLNRMIKDPEQHPAPSGIKPKHLIKDILQRVTDMAARVDTAFSAIIRELRRNSVFFVDEDSITPLQMQYVNQYFVSKVRSRLFPIMLEKDRPFPYMKHVTIYLTVSMYNEKDPENHRFALIELPTDVLPRYIRIPSRNQKKYFIILDDIIRLCLKEIFHMFNYDTFKAYTIKITRDGEYDLAEEVTKSLYEKLSTSLKQRKMGDPVRVVYDRRMPKQLFSYIMKHADLQACNNIIAGGKYHNARDVINFPKINKKELYFSEQPPIPNHRISLNRSLIEQIEERDHLLALPYQRYHYIIDLLREAALDPDVSSIKMTLYRVAEDSSVVNALRNAARNGKKVTVFIELQARFDEKNNMYWTDKLSQERNITLISGVEGFKVHSKLCIITRKKKKEKEKRRIALVGTGNFNESTASIYTDHILMTSHPGITDEVNRVFKLLNSSFYEAKFKHLIVSPLYTRKKIIKHIKEEIRQVNEGGSGEIIIKLNNLVDEKMIKWLLRAADAGVSIKLLIRGIFSMKTLSSKGKERENIIARAMIDRYLEHTRIIKFQNGGEPVFYIGSADWMVRNLDNRIEVMAPIYDADLKNELDQYLEYHLRDTYSSFSLNTNTFNVPLQRGTPDETRAQRDLYLLYKTWGEEHRDESSQAEPSQAEPSQAETAQAEPSQAEPSQAETAQQEQSMNKLSGGS
ncbi:MAG: polyphosphate kinase 1 [Spirochaetales bacterium]|nr:polyphosphate kinase 1 [Spirochaetales bacterium]